MGRTWRKRSYSGQDRFFRDMRGQLALTACRAPSFALFGIGDIVFDQIHPHASAVDLDFTQLADDLFRFVRYKDWMRSQ